MKAFHGNEQIKAKYLARVQAHRAADEIAKGFYWQGGRGCAVGCTIHGSEHWAYERELGVPRMLALLEDTLFEGMPLDKAKSWPEEFLSAIPVGADLSLVGWKFLHWLLTEHIQVPGDDAIVIRVREALSQSAKVIEPLTRGEPVDKKAAKAATRAAEEEEAWAAAWAARAAASALASAEAAAEEAEEAAAWAARTAAAEAVTHSYYTMSRKLLSLLQEAGQLEQVQR